MHLTEFKAWFEGFTEEMKGTPTKDQWAKIKKRVKDITADYTPAPVFIHDYYRPWRRYWGYEPYWATTSNTIGMSSSNAQTVASSSYETTKATVDLKDWMAAGRAEFCALK